MTHGWRRAPHVVLGGLFCTLALAFVPRVLRAEPGEVPPALLAPVVVEDQIPRGEVSEDISAFATVIDPKEYQGEFKNTGELLERSVGVRIIDFGGLGQSQVVSIRGSSAEQVVVLLDGVRLNSGQRGGVDIASIPLEIVDRIEVIRGGESALYGTDAVGGVVNIRTKRGSATKPISANAEVRGGSFETLQGAGSVGGGMGPFDYFVSHTHLSSDGDFSFVDDNGLLQSRINNKFYSEAPFLRLGLESKSFGRLELVEQFYLAERGQPGFGTSQLPAAASDEWKNRLALKYRKPGFLWKNLEFSSTFFDQLEDFEFADPLPRIGPPIRSDTRTHAYGGDLRWDLTQPATEKVTNTASFLVDLRQDEADVFSDAAAAVNFQNVHSERFRYALALQDELHLFSEALSLNLALRFEDTSLSGGEWIPKAGARWRVLPWLFLKANGGRMYRVPNFDELFFPESESIGGNPNLQPEEGWTVDAGFEVKTKPFFLSATAFYHRLTNAIFFVPISATRIEPINLLDESISQGVEVAAEWDPIKYLSFRGAYTYLDHFFDDTHYLLPGRANHDVDGRVTLRLPPWFRIYFETEYLSEFAVVLAASGGQLEADRLLFHSGFSVSPVDFLTLAFDAKNLTNEQTLNDSRDVPLPGRQFYGSAQVHF